MPPFGDFESFLELAFAVNLIWGIWGDLRARLENRFGNPKLKTQVAAAIDTSSATAVDSLVERARRWRSGLSRVGQVASLAVAVAIAMCLFFVQSTVELSGGWRALVFFAMCPVPVFAFFMWLVNPIFTLAVWLKAGRVTIDSSPIDNVGQATKDVQKSLTEDGSRESSDGTGTGSSGNG
ncbi:MAG: hypothetical protein F4Y86_16990 [Gammaproteobacteria bacterium]|nr:hypothetical protein [Gammaproteobacteria bacterium]